MNIKHGVFTLGALQSFLTSHLNLRGLSGSRSRQAVRSVKTNILSNQGFWTYINSLVVQRSIPIELSGFQIVDWYPRSPGYYHLKGALAYRKNADLYIDTGCSTNSLTMYTPMGKSKLIRGGLGSVRLRPQEINGETIWFCTATSDGACHSGVPLMIPDRIFRYHNILDTTFDVVGVPRFIPNILQEHILQSKGIYQVCLYVEQLIPTQRSHEPVMLTPMVFFQTDSDLRHDAHIFRQRAGYPVSHPFRNTANTSHIIDGANAVFFMVNAADHYALDAVPNQVQEYVDRYNGTIITDYDEQKPAFGHLPFGLSNIMQKNPEQIRNLYHTVVNIEDVINNGIIVGTNEGNITQS